ncbi:histidine acid phosphatase [Tritrichomonas foetus]|uniref:Histidine acid phosphatase n=1 Tax=Tritrichomonas foetus TaxID=1144522 RepID=A0A1J4KC57_9EUKA|nr:histidine acid phosphatase [Tritrichomonas foetus]|eukprot:OHT08512.1 histidine acid phosphatase [Tritrichomonas foetus]
MFNTSILCVAPLQTPPPIPGATLLTLFLFTRHGMRSPEHLWHLPGNEGVWSCGDLSKVALNKFKNISVNGKPFVYKSFNESEFYPFPPSCQKGMLLNEGIKELRDLGKLYKHYVIEHNVIPEKFNKDLFYVRSSYVPRCIDSAIAFTSGFYDNDDDIEIDIPTGSFGHEPIAPFPGGSKLLFAEAEKFIETDEYKYRINRSKEIIAQFDDKLNVTFQMHELEALTFGDYINTMICSNQTLPFEMTENLHSEIMNHMNFIESGFFNFTLNPTAGPIIELVLNKIEDYYGLESHSKFNYFSGHDGTIAALLEAFGQRTFSPPPFASHFLLEIWYSDRPYLRAVYNGEVIKTMPLSEFKKWGLSLVEANQKMLEELENKKN